MSFGGTLSASGVALHEQFLAPEQIRLLAQCLNSRRRHGDFTAARIGTQGKLQRRAEIRGDFTYWMREPLRAIERALLDRVEQLRLQLNRENFLGLFETELHYAWYPPGAGYARHVDQPQGLTQRKVSLVLYLNEDWDDAAGGVLRLFDAADDYRDIQPIGGRLVCFLTAGREHAVLPARRDRLSVSGWFRTRG